MVYVHYALGLAVAVWKPVFPLQSGMRDAKLVGIPPAIVALKL